MATVPSRLEKPPGPSNPWAAVRSPARRGSNSAYDIRPLQSRGLRVSWRAVDVVSVVGSFAGLAVSAFGVWFAFFAKREAGGARKAAEAARQAIKRSLTGVDAGRATGLIERIQILNRQGHWQAAMHMYKDLGAMLSDLQESHWGKESDVARSLREAREQLRTIEDALEETLADALEPGSLLGDTNVHLNRIHNLLLPIQSKSRIGQGSF